MTTSKAQRIEIWLQEVVTASQLLSPPPSASSSVSPPSSPVAEPTSTKRSSLIAKILRRPALLQSRGSGSFERTEMYRADLTGSKSGARDRGGVAREGSMDIGSAIDSEDDPAGGDKGLMARRERLERAARLLNGEKVDKG